MTPVAFIINIQLEPDKMQLKAILNRVAKCKSFVYQTPKFVETILGFTIEIPIKPRANSQPICSVCQQHCPGYDHMPEPRRFDFIPLWGIAVVLIYTLRRVECKQCGVKVEQVPWAQGKSPLTIQYQWFLAKWAKRLS